MYTKHLIVGAGIAGLFIALQLQAMREPFLLFEASTQPNSKLVSRSTDSCGHSTTLELGASVFHSHQDKLMWMIQKLGLQHSLIKLGSSRKVYVYQDMLSDQVETKFKQLQHQVQLQMDDPRFQLSTLEQAAQEILSTEEFELLSTCWDCWYEVKDQNAKCVFAGMKQEGTYYRMKGGLEQLIYAGWNRFASFLKLGYKVVSIDKTPNKSYFVQLADGVTYITQHLYVCTSFESLAGINFRSFNPAIRLYQQLGETQPSIRLYLQLQPGIKLPFDQVVGQVVGRWWIKVDDCIVMLYCDGNAASELHSMNKTQLIEMFCQDLKHISNIETNDVKVLEAWWPDAYTILKAKYFEETASNSLPQLPFVVTSLPTPLDQAWMNGHLRWINKVYLNA